MIPEPLAYLNGQFLPSSEARLPLHDAGFVFGATVTDFCRTFRHHLFRLADHLARFRAGCERAYVPQPVSDAALTKLAEQLIAHNSRGIAPERDLALVMFATPGPLGHYAGSDDRGPPTLGMHTFPLAFSRYRRFFQEGAHLIVPPTRHAPPDTIDPNIKQRGRLHWWIAEHQIQQLEPGAHALLLDAVGHVTETAFGNFLLVRGGTVLTPPRSTVLSGVSLQVVEELCRQEGIPFREQVLTVADCLVADEIMLSGTSFCLAGVSRLNGAAIPWPGSIFRQLLMGWGQSVGIDIAAQILADG